MPPIIVDEHEIRFFPLTELRVDDNPEGKPTIFGYAAVFDQLSLNLGGFQERIARGAFSKSIQEDDIRDLFNHNPDYVLGRNKAKTLRLWEDIHGLRFELDPPDTQAGRDLVTSIKRGDIDQMSFAFRAIKDQWEELEAPNEAGVFYIRTLIEARLYDVSQVVYPAYPQTSAAVREEVQQLQEKRTAEAARAGAQADQAKAQARRSILRRKLELTELD